MGERALFAQIRNHGVVARLPYERLVMSLCLRSLSRRALAPVILAGLAFTASPSWADQTPHPMTGEFLFSLPPADTTGGTCNPAGISTVSFEVSGTAIGPYAGTFTEVGTATFGPAIHPIEGNPGQFRSELLTFSADFTITSTAGTVTGHKELPEGSGLPTDVGNGAGCFSTTFGEIGPVAQILSNRLVYTATTPTGTDSGTSAVNMNTYPTPTANSSSNQFREWFYPSTTGTPPAPQCSNNVDDDNDGKVDFPADPGCSSATDDSESPDPAPPAPQCSNNVDDDSDGKVDFPADPGCSSATDDSESPDPAPPAPQCSNNVDDDSDGKVDFPADPGCSSATDDSESPDPAPPAPQCSNNVDDDSDGKVDFPADPGCSSATDDSESPDPAPPAPQCSNNVDDDSDGKVDFPADPGCSSATDDSESPDPAPPAPQCSNNVDDDSDGKVDFPADPGCSSATDDSESPDPAPPTPTSADQCKNGGWQNYAWLAFKNQGDCVSFVATNGKNAPNGPANR